MHHNGERGQFQGPDPHEYQINHGSQDGNNFISAAPKLAAKVSPIMGYLPSFQGEGENCIVSRPESRKQ